MKRFFKYGVLSSLIVSASSFAINPVPGFYGGFLGEMSNGPSSRDIAFDINRVHYTGTVNYSSIGGGGAAYIGYRISRFRAEAELLYNRISYGTLSIGSCTLQSPNIPPTGVCPANFVNNNLGFNGSTSVFYGFFNGYFEYLFNTEDSTAIGPYIGAGIGYSRLTNSRNFVNVMQNTSFGGSRSASSGAAQGIIGVAYFIDDYVSFGMDYRYVTTNTISDFADTRYGLNTLNFLVNFAFDK